MGHGILEESSELFFLSLKLCVQPGCQNKNTSLRDCAFNQSINMIASEPKILQSRRLVTKVGEELGQRLSENFTGALLFHVGNIDAKCLCSFEMSSGIRSSGKAEHGWGRDGDGDTVRNQGRRNIIASVLIARVLS